MTATDRAESFLQLIRRANRGRLKVYLGYSAGVGKTYQMLQEAHRLKTEGVDVIVGIVETHGRTDTAALVDGLEVIPRRKIEYHGVTMEEMDLQAILARRPQVCLVDELAHTNLPGSVNAKRYQDVQDILDAGIHVMSTLNLQHLESLYHTVEKLIGVKVSERLPDSVLSEADQIVNVDLTPEDLQKRLKAGKVYHHDRVATALDNFFTASNLQQLRELSLREVASQIDLKRRETLQDENNGSNSPDQVMVCLSSGGPNSGVLLRYGSRLAGRLNRNWYAVYVQTPSEDPVRIDSATQRGLNDTLTLANQLGAMVFTFKGQDIADTILRFAREYRVGHVVIGRPHPVPLWKRMIGRTSVAEQLIHKASGLSIVVIDAHAERPIDTSAHAAAALTLLTPPATEPPLSLSSLLGIGQVLIWERPATRDQIFRDMIKAAKLKDPTLDVDLLLRRLIEREDQGSTFMNEGVALPHIRMEALRESIAVLGLAHAGVSDVKTDKPVEVVVFLLSPESQAGNHLQLLAAAARLLQNRTFRRRLIAYDSPEKVLTAVHEAELS